MNNQELYEKIKEVLRGNSIGACDEMSLLIDTQVKEKIEKDDKKRFLFYKKRLALHKLEIKRDSMEPSKEKIHLSGQITKEYQKLIKEASSNNEQLEVKHEHLESKKKHKECIHEYQKQSKGKIPILEKVGLKIQEIAKTIDIFMEEKDVLTKFKNTIKDTIRGSASSLAILAGVGLAVQVLTGLPVTLASVASAMPIIAYIGLTSTIRNFIHKTEFQQYEYQQSDEYKELVENFKKEHEAELLEIANLLKEKESTHNLEDIIRINEGLITITDRIISQCKIDGVRQAFELQALGYFRENQACCEKIKDDYLEERYDDKERYKENNKRLAKINLEIFKRGNSIKDAVKDAGKSIASGTAIMIAAKAILAMVAPGTFSLTDFRSLLIPFMFLVINGIIDIPTYVNKLKYRETDYEGKVSVHELERIKKIIELKKQEMGMDNYQAQPSFV